MSQSSNVGKNKVKVYIGTSCWYYKGGELGTPECESTLEELFHKMGIHEDFEIGTSTYTKLGGWVTTYDLITKQEILFKFRKEVDEKLSHIYAGMDDAVYGIYELVGTTLQKTYFDDKVLANVFEELWEKYLKKELEDHLNGLKKEE